MTPHILHFIPGSLEDTDKYIEFVYGHYVTAKQKVKVQIIMCNNNGNPFIMTLHNVSLAPDLCDRLFSITMLIHLVHTCLFNKWFCTLYLGNTNKIR